MPETPKTPEITDAQLHELFARHCACRPLDLTRDARDHAAIHDCDTAILRDVQVALGLAFFDETGEPIEIMWTSVALCLRARRRARARCAEYLKLVPNALGGYSPPEEDP